MAGYVRDERGRPAELYRLYDAADRLLYVGVSCQVVERLRSNSHRCGKPWWSEVAYCTLESFPKGWQALEAEVSAIRRERPRYNKRSAVAS